MKNKVKKVMGAVLAFALLSGAMAVPSQNVQAAVKLKEKDVIIPQGGSFHLNVSGEIEKEDVECTSSNPKVAKVDDVYSSDSGGAYAGDDRGDVVIDVDAKKKGKAVCSVKVKGKTLKAKITVVPKISKADVTTVKAGGKNVNPLGKYKNYKCAMAIYARNNQQFKGTLRGIKINSSLNQIADKYGNVYYGVTGSTTVGSNKCFDKVNDPIEKDLLKKMKVSGVTKVYRVSGSGSYLSMYLDKSNKVKAVAIGNYGEMCDMLRPDNYENKSQVPKLNVSGNVLYLK